MRQSITGAGPKTQARSQIPQHRKCRPITQPAPISSDAARRRQNPPRRLSWCNDTNTRYGLSDRRDGAIVTRAVPVAPAMRAAGRARDRASSTAMAGGHGNAAGQACRRPFPGADIAHARRRPLEVSDHKTARARPEQPGLPPSIWPASPDHVRSRIVRAKSTRPAPRDFATSRLACSTRQHAYPHHLNLWQRSTSASEFRCGFSQDF